MVLLTESSDSKALACVYTRRVNTRKTHRIRLFSKAGRSVFRLKLKSRDSNNSLCAGEDRQGRRQCRRVMTVGLTPERIRTVLPVA